MNRRSLMTTLAAAVLGVVGWGMHSQASSKATLGTCCVPGAECCKSGDRACCLTDTCSEAGCCTEACCTKEKECCQEGAACCFPGSPCCTEAASCCVK
jgi:hypothetical protein